LVWGLAPFVFPIKLFLFGCEVKERKEMTEKYPITVDEVRDAQDSLRTGITEHEAKNFKEAIAAFKKSAMIHPFDEQHISELETKLKGGNFKLQQESIAYMGCAAVHLNEMIHGLDEDQKQEVPIDDSLTNAFKDW
jgi:uncharacterized protein YceH (UPF0502 family)